jgi:subtilisin family serine protease
MPTYRCLMLRPALLSLSLVLAACGGGGGGGVAGLPTPDPLDPDPPTAAEFENTADFDPCITASDNNTYCSHGLGQIGAAHVYAQGATGSGVVVAVIDSGIDTAHIELDSQISSQSKDIVSPSTPMTDELGHGTEVAGIIAAERNSIGMHGVAFDATILAVRADGRYIDGTSTSAFEIGDVTNAINYAAGKAHVINMSLGVAGTQLGDSWGHPLDQQAFEQALINAMGNGAIIVAASGNESASEPSLPAAYAGDTTINASGQMLAVGAVNNTGTALADFSNQCGVAKDYCLVAPGDGIWTTYPGDYLAYVSADDGDRHGR